MPIGKIGGNAGNSIPDLNELDSNPQSVASATGNEAKTGGIGHRAVQFLSNISSSIREVADSFANAIEARFSGSAKDNLKSLFNREPKQIDTPIELKTFKSHIDDTYAQVSNPTFENSTYGDTSFNKSIDSEYSLADAASDTLEGDSNYVSLSEVRTRPAEKDSIYQNVAPAVEEAIYQNVATRAELDSDEYVLGEFASDDYVEAAPEELYASLADIATESLYVQLSDVTTNDFGGFKPDATQPADTAFHKSVGPNSSPALKQALGFVRYVLDHHGASGGQALESARIFNSKTKNLVGQITPELFNIFQVKLKEAKAANAARVTAGFAPSAGEVRYEKFNSDNVNSPIHSVLQKEVFASSPKLANKVKWEFDQVLARGFSGASPADIAHSVARQVVAEKLKESFEASRSDSPLHPLLSASALASETDAKLESIKVGYDEALNDAALDYAYEGGLDKPFNPDAFKDLAIAAAKSTIEKYTF